MSRFAPITLTKPKQNLVTDKYKYGFSDPTDSYSFISKPGLSRRVVEEISHIKGEPAWMLERRLQALQYFEGARMPPWGADLSGINFDKIHYYLRPTDRENQSWDDVPEYIKR